jgi:membrane protein implicated in regulation of membrane protease activity
MFIRSAIRRSLIFWSGQLIAIIMTIIRTSELSPVYWWSQGILAVVGAIFLTLLSWISYRKLLSTIEGLERAVHQDRKS